MELDGVLPPPPRVPAASVRRVRSLAFLLLSAALLALPWLMVGLVEEVRADHRRAATWRTGQPVDATVVRHEFPEGWFPGPRRVVFSFVHAGATREARRVVLPRDLGEWPVGSVLPLRVDPAHPDDPSLPWDAAGDAWWPLDLLAFPAVLLLIAAGLAVLARVTDRRYRVLRDGVAVPARVLRRHPAFAQLHQVEYAWDGVTHRAWVDIPVVFWPAPLRAALLVLPGRPGACAAALPTEIVHVPGPQEQAHALAEVVDRWVRLPGPAAALAGLPARLRAVDDNAARDAVAALEALLAGPALEVFLDRWLRGHAAALAPAQRAALGRLHAVRRIRRHVALRFAIVSATAITVVVGGVLGLFLGVAPGALELALYFTVFAVVLWLAAGGV
ncbi:MAG: hypothetical protein HY904_13435 [Deltaproteobacteria bacterium]|nr:hypothetical protein [Deltaproteobacteria bacterium]